MRRWLGVRGVPRGISAWLALAAAIGGWHCSVDGRSPKEKEVVTAEMPSGGTSESARFSKVPSGGAAGSGAVEQTGGAAGSSTGSSGMGSGGSGTTGNSAGSTGMTSPGAGGAPPVGDLPDDPFGGLGDFAEQGSAAGASNTGSPSGSTSTCPGFDACGGALAGTWTYSNVCIDPSENSADLLAQACPTASVTYEPGGTATLTFTGSAVSRVGSPVGDSVINFPAECLEGFGCSLFAGAFAECTDMGSACVCRTPSSVDWGTQSYTTTGGRLSLGDGRSFDYCVQGDTLTYRETGDAQEAGTHTLTRN